MSAQHHLEAEQAVLGAMMSADQAITDVEPILGDGRGFYRPAHGEIYRAILGLRDRNEPTDPINLTADLTATGLIEKVGGASYLHDCFAAAALPQQATHYAGIVAGFAALRDLGKAGARITNAAATAGHADAPALLERAREWLTQVDAAPAKETLRLWRDTTPGLLDAIEQAGQTDPADTPGVPTGLHDLDEILGGLQPGNLVLVAARPGVGKSVLLLNMAANAAMRHKLRTAVFSLEMSELEVGLRVAAACASLPLASLKSGRLDDIGWSKLARFVGESDDAPLHIDETTTVTLAHIRAGARRLIAQHGNLDLLIVDYLQLMQPANPRDTRQEQVASLSRGLKLLAGELGVPIVAACQLNRGPEQRGDKRPTKSDIRESGSLEADADVVILLHREDVHDHESPKAGECDVIVDKNRHGRQATITVAAQLHMSRFVSMAIPA